MARIRTIKPEFWEDEVIGTLSTCARLLFIASWNVADDEGLLRWTPPYLKSVAFMYDDAIGVGEVAGYMDEIERSGLVYPYRGGKAKQQLGYVVHFHRHQKINRPQPSRLPAPSLQSSAVRGMYARRDSFTCHLCKRPVVMDATSGEHSSRGPSIDHLTPISKGGTDYPSNVMLSHISCNKSRKDKDLQPFSESFTETFTDPFTESVVSNSLPEGKGKGWEVELERKKETRAKALGASAANLTDPWDEQPDPEEPPADGRDVKAQLAYFMPLLRKLHFKADQHDGSIVKALMAGKAPRSPPSVDRAVRGLAWARDRGLLREGWGIGNDDELSMRILYTEKQGVRPVWNQAVDEWYPKSVQTAAKASGLTPIRIA